MFLKSKITSTVNSNDEYFLLIKENCEEGKVHNGTKMPNNDWKSSEVLADVNLDDISEEGINTENFKIVQHS